MSLSEIEQLMPREREEFIRCAALLMAKTFIPRETIENTLSREYSFIQRKYLLFEEYLALSGWRLYSDRQLGIIYVSNTEGYNRVSLNKLTTQVLITLRLIFEEKRLSGSIVNVVGVTVGELLDKMINELSVLSKKPVMKELKDSFKMLEQHNIIYRIGETYDEMECRIKILPSILVAVPNDRCKTVYEILKTESQEDDNEACDENSADKLALLFQ